MYVLKLYLRYITLLEILSFVTSHYATGMQLVIVCNYLGHVCDYLGHVCDYLGHVCNYKFSIV
jgi:hypothetical protein